MSNNRVRGFVPELESLETRCLLATSVVQTGSVITITGDPRDNVIKITDNGGNAAGAVTIQADGRTFTSTGSVTDIVVRARGGNDRVRYTLGSLQANVVRNVREVMGAGHDVFRAVVTGDLNSGSVLDIRAVGRTGRDRLSITATSMDIPDGARASFFLNGNQHDDTVTVDWMGELDGSLTSQVFGGGGRNRVRHRLTPLPGSTGVLNNVTLDGGPDHVVVHPLLGPITINAGDVSLLDLSGLNLGSLGLGTLPDLVGLLDQFHISPLDLSNLDFNSLPLGSLLGLPDLDILDLDGLGIPLDQVGLGFIDLDDLANGLLTFNILDPSLVNLDTLIGGLLNTNGQALIQINLSGIVGGLVANLLTNLGVQLNLGQGSVDLRVLSLAELNVPNLGLGVFDLRALADGRINLGVLSVEDLKRQLGITTIGLGIIGNVW